MLPPFKGPNVVVQLLCRLHQSADFSQDRFSGPSYVYLHIISREVIMINRTQIIKFLYINLSE